MAVLETVLLDMSPGHLSTEN